MVKVNKPQKYYAMLIVGVCTILIVLPIVFVERSFGLWVFTGIGLSPLVWYLVQAGRTYVIDENGVIVIWVGIIKRVYSWDDISISVCTLKEKACLYHKYFVMSRQALPVPLRSTSWFELRSSQYYLIEYTKELNSKLRNVIPNVKIHYIS